MATESHVLDQRAVRVFTVAVYLQLAGSDRVATSTDLLHEFTPENANKLLAPASNDGF